MTSMKICDESTSVVTGVMADVPLILALDIGTSSVRAMLFDRAGRAVQGMRARQSYELHTTRDGAVEADPDTMLERIWRCIDTLSERGGGLMGRVGGVAVCTFVSNVLGVDKQGHAIVPLITYADTRSVEDVAHLSGDLDEETVHQRTGCKFHTSYLPARLRWLARTQLEVFERVERWMSIGEYMELRLFGETAVSHSVASWTGLLDWRRLKWDELLLAAVSVDEERLSRLTDVQVFRQGLRDPFAKRWPALRDVPWYPAIGDGAAANIGSGCTSPERVAVTMGSTSAVRLITEEDVERVPHGLWCYRVDRRRLLPGGALSEGGNVFAWMQKRLNLPHPLAVDELLAAMEPDAHGLTVLPFLAGERSPGWVGEARATLHGLSLATTSLDMLRASMEAVAYRIALIFDRLAPLLPPHHQVVASGGALLNSPAWGQIVADVLGRPVTISRVEEASARGASLLALEAMGHLEHISEAASFLGRPVEPRERWHTVYRKAMERQQEIYRRLI
jgi:gluconokinase